MLPVVTAVLGVVGEVVQVVTMAGVAWPSPAGRPDAENLQNLFFFRSRMAALAPADPYTINIPRPRAPLTKPFGF